MFDRFRLGFQIFALSFACIVGLQIRAGAWRAELNSDPDEAAHYVTGIMVRDYIAAGVTAEPLAFARNYYLHYPRVALGHWPPLFYVAQAAWTLPFGASRVSVMIFMAVLAALVSLITYRMFSVEFSPLTSAAAVLVLLTLPAFQLYSQTVMTEMFLGVLILLGVSAYADYLERGSWRSAMWFGLWAAAALLAKGSAIQLAWIPPIAILLSRRWELLTRFSFWLPAVIVAVLAAPWYLFIPGAQHESVARYGDVQFDYPRLWGTFTWWEAYLGALPALAALLGVAVLFEKVRRNAASGRWIAVLAAVVGAYLTRLFIAAFEARQLMPTLPLLILLGVSGVEWLVRRPWFARRPANIAPAVTFAAVAVVVAINLYRSPHKHPAGYAEVALSLESQSQFKDSVLMTCSDAIGEGMLISEIAMNEQRPGHIVLRGSKMLASFTWMGNGGSLFHSSQEQLEHLESISVDVIVLDRKALLEDHCRMLSDGLKATPEKWQRLALAEAASADPSNPIEAYRFTGSRKEQKRIRLPIHGGVFGEAELR